MPYSHFTRIAEGVFTRTPDIEVEIHNIAVLGDGRVYGAVRHAPSEDCTASDFHEINACGELHLRERCEIIEKFSLGGPYGEKEAEEKFQKAWAGLAFESLECESSQDSA